ncbi:TPA: DUF2913 family protein [Serratia marcescens]|nr:DUF2913 family protein [Serratia marcescens]
MNSQNATRGSETEATLTALSNLAFCAIIALEIARKDGIATTPLTENLFLVRWLATAQKQKRFPKCVAIDIAFLLDQGRSSGPTCNLRRKLQSLWQSCTAPLSTQTDLFRLTYVTEKLRDKGWENYTLDSKTWRKKHMMSIPQTSGYYTEESALHNAYSDNGSLIHSIELRIVGDINLLLTLMSQSGINTKLLEGDEFFHRVMLIPLDHKTT